MDTDIEKYVTLYSRDLTKLCMNLCSNLQDAEDLFQDTWAKAIRYFDKYDSSKPFDKWLFSICVNTYKNNLKLVFNKRRVTFSSEEESQLFSILSPTKVIILGTIMQSFIKSLSLCRKNKRLCLFSGISGICQ